jgi:hypothetical protein
VTYVEADPGEVWQIELEWRLNGVDVESGLRSPTKHWTEGARPEIGWSRWGWWLTFPYRTMGQVRGVAGDPAFCQKKERARLASYFFLALMVSRAFATKTSNRGSL